MLLRIHESLCRGRTKFAVLFELQELLEHNRGRTICSTTAALLDGRHNKGAVACAGINARRSAEPCGFAASRVSVDKCSFAVPVYSDTAKAHLLGNNAEGYRINASIQRPPVCGKAV